MQILQIIDPNFRVFIFLPSLLSLKNLSVLTNDGAEIGSCIFLLIFLKQSQNLYIQNPSSCDSKSDFPAITTQINSVKAISLSSIALIIFFLSSVSIFLFIATFPTVHPGLLNA
jgi:hypothetical protein